MIEKKGFRLEYLVMLLLILLVIARFLNTKG